MGMRSILVWDNIKLRRTIIHDPECSISETSTNQVLEGLTILYTMFAVYFKYPDQIHEFPEVTMPKQREEWFNHTTIIMDADTWYSNYGEE